MNTPLVSAVIITHNRKELLAKSIDSVFAQTWPCIEVIVADDASDENAASYFLEKYSDKPFHYQYIPKAESKGGNHARNVGIALSQGSYIAFLDDDDEWLPDKIEKQMTCLLSRPGAGFCSCGIIREYDFGKREADDFRHAAEGDLHEKIWGQIPFLTSTLLIRKECLEMIGGFDEDLRYWQEYEMELRLTQVTEAAVIYEPLVLYRILHKDKGRLTNHLEGWERATAEIEGKHRNLYEKLPEELKEAYQEKKIRDGLLRAHSNGDKKNLKKYLKKLAVLRPTPVNRLKCLLNVYRLDPRKNRLQ